MQMATRRDTTVALRCGHGGGWLADTVGCDRGWALLFVFFLRHTDGGKTVTHCSGGGTPGVGALAPAAKGGAAKMQALAVKHPVCVGLWGKEFCMIWTKSPYFSFVSPLLNRPGLYCVTSIMNAQKNNPTIKKKKATFLCSRQHDDALSGFKNGGRCCSSANQFPVDDNNIVILLRSVEGKIMVVQASTITRMWNALQLAWALALTTLQSSEYNKVESPTRTLITIQLINYKGCTLIISIKSQHSILFELQLLLSS